MWETRVWSLGCEDLLEKEMATHSSILAWWIPWTEDPDRLQSMGSQRVRHDWATSLSRLTWGLFKKMQIVISFQSYWIRIRVRWANGVPCWEFIFLTRFLCVYAQSYPTLLWPPWTVAFQARLSMEFSRQENWSGLPFPIPENLPDPGIELVSLKSPALAMDSLPSEPSGKPIGR